MEVAVETQIISNLTLHVANLVQEHQDASKEKQSTSIEYRQKIKIKHDKLDLLCFLLSPI